MAPRLAIPRMPAAGLNTPNQARPRASPQSERTLAPPAQTAAQPRAKAVHRSEPGKAAARATPCPLTSMECLGCSGYRHNYKECPSRPSLASVVASPATLQFSETSPHPSPAYTIALPASLAPARRPPRPLFVPSPYRSRMAATTGQPSPRTRPISARPSS